MYIPFYYLLHCVFRLWGTTNAQRRDDRFPWTLLKASILRLCVEVAYGNRNESLSENAGLDDGIRCVPI